MSCQEISADWAAQRIKGLSLGTAIINALSPKRKPKDRQTLERFRRCVSLDLVVVEFPPNAAEASAAAVGASPPSVYWSISRELPVNGSRFLTLGYGNMNMSQLNQPVSQTPQLSQGANKPQVDE